MSDPWALAEHDAGTCSPFTCPACEHKRAAAAGIIPPVIRCAICGDTDVEPADCPDRHGWEDHGTCCLDNCGACREELLW